jgi:hypothetical protein
MLYRLKHSVADVSDTFCTFLRSSCIPQAGGFPQYSMRPGTLNTHSAKRLLLRRTTSRYRLVDLRRQTIVLKRGSNDDPCPVEEAVDCRDIQSALGGAPLFELRTLKVGCSSPRRLICRNRRVPLCTPAATLRYHECRGPRRNGAQGDRLRRLKKWAAN